MFVMGYPEDVFLAASPESSKEIFQTLWNVPEERYETQDEENAA